MLVLRISPSLQSNFVMGVDSFDISLTWYAHTKNSSEVSASIISFSLFTFNSTFRLSSDFSSEDIGISFLLSSPLIKPIIRIILYFQYLYFLN